MTTRSIQSLLVSVLGICLLGAGCGGGSGATGGAPATGAAHSGETGAGASTPGGVPSDAQSAATGDIPDSQVFLTFADRAAGYSIRYPEGWTQGRAAAGVTFQDRANVIDVTIGRGRAPSAADATAGVARLKLTDPSVRSGSPQRVTVDGAPVVKITYTRLSTADPVTGKRLPLTIDRYEYAHAGRTAIVDLGTPKGVDNVDAYRMISRSFRWL